MLARPGLGPIVFTDYGRNTELERERAENCGINIRR